MAFRFIHSADLHLGRRFTTLPEDARGRLAEARHQALATLAQAAHDHAAQHILIAGDLFDSETPADPVWRQAAAAMGGDLGLHWWLIPGGHDSLAAASLWSGFRRHVPPNVHLISEAAPAQIAPGVVLLPAPVPSRRPGQDLTAWMAAHDSGPRPFRIGLAHGAVRGLSADGMIPPDRAETARLDYLALGCGHGQTQISPRTWVCGTPERDAFHPDGRGSCLAVTLTAPGALPDVKVVPTGRFVWTDLALPLGLGEAAHTALLALLPAQQRRDHLIRVRAWGMATLAEQAAVAHVAEAVSPEFCDFGLYLTGLYLTGPHLTGLSPAGTGDGAHIINQSPNQSPGAENRGGPAPNALQKAHDRLSGNLRNSAG